ncbi:MULTISPECIES: flagellar hook-associated family protein [Rhizobium]|jgi:flagellar hook-associated protein 3 FlgL|uniref:Flagellin n=1 Tax=Rhizobium miluonense TaxID=411945 RepID=A0ABU1SIW1_9HYPH|nr:MULTISPECIES: flagellar hook-associated family protein [Rhizobium]MBB3384674.1 flagellar hook-associated protein 3 FlgL [Rhizobium sp. BK098]MBB3426585.1 flagellar hook-associated protein 3 FlgL [Rhizobium sp. BK312]MBB3568030.1 flagellar hook-associated protein 3 FlgL [Rhizobium sp. BK491]MBB3616751.1 flagellar hook-associated protein 3 FlgL [Rhizobium sp. BK609]MBB3682408.1 flagellar hook-associated protein 3 FlgL [Rhizobium sp. BK612]
MKLSFISSTAIQNAMRQTVRQAQNEMTSASTEATTGVYADIGVSLGGSTSLNVNLTREVSRIDSILSSNSIANQRMTTSQTALTGMGTQAQKLMDQLVALSGNTDGSSVALAQQAASSTLSNVIASANTMVNGEYLFAGTNTDVQPMTDQSATTNAAIQSALTTYMAAQSPAVTAATISADQITDFIKTKVEPMFTSDPSWSSWSSASDQNMTSRISNSEVIESSTNANSSGIRYLALATSVTNALMGTPPGLNQSAVNAVTKQAISYTRQSVDGLNSQASQLGLSQSRLSDANTTLNAQKTILTTSIGDLTGVDPYEASTKVNSLQTQLQTAYTIVSKIQQLSLVNYL